MVVVAADRDRIRTTEPAFLACEATARIAYSNVPSRAPHSPCCRLLRRPEAAKARAAHVEREHLTVHPAALEGVEVDPTSAVVGKRLKILTKESAEDLLGIVLGVPYSARAVTHMPCPIVK